MQQTDKKYFSLLFWITAFVILGLIACSLTSCKLLSKVERSSKTNSTDTTSVKKEISQGSSADTSKTKKNETNEKTTVYYPQPIIVPGKDGETKVVFVPQTVRETGTKSEQTDNYKFDEWMRRKEDSLRIASLQEQLSKNTETKAFALSLGDTIGLSILGLVIIGVVIMFMWIVKKVNIISQIKNTIQ